ncbi:hypothetical protein OCU04_007556 [Sclerotinia nivalis]|uniref:AA1-like domain-containing protein n=1 Tax=Sclerotinia nivalis TaxID=352851 RepID=A0A9X0DHG2_9HELO|nr:hypothetical protein OCU04_007556 [Sclerotinia nivalis]
MNTTTFFTFLALLASCVFSAPIDNFTISHVARNDYPSAGDIVITFYARGGDFFQQTFPADGNPYVIDNPLKISHLVAKGTGFCAITGYSGNFTQTQDTCGPLSVSPVSVQVWGQCSTRLPEEGFGLDVVPRI